MKKAVQDLAAETIADTIAGKARAVKEKEKLTADQFQTAPDSGFT